MMDDMQNQVRLALFLAALGSASWFGLQGIQNIQAAEWSANSGQAAAQSSTRRGAPVITPEMRAHIDAGNNVFQQNCAFCHGRDAGGGESGPDLTRSRLVVDDVNGEKIGDVIHNGRPGRMPAFPLSEADTSNVVAFLHAQHLKAASEGQRKGVDPSDLLTGNAAAGKQYFEGAGGCTKCHSATGDLAHVGSKYQGLQLMQHMLYPRDAKSKATVTLPSGEKLTGIVEYHDEFALGITLPDGTYRSWPTEHLKYTLDEPQEAHADLFSKYTDTDIHNIYAYLEGLH